MLRQWLNDGVDRAGIVQGHPSYATELSTVKTHQCNRNRFYPSPIDFTRWTSLRGHIFDERLAAEL